MRNWHALLASTATMALAIGLSPNSWGQDGRTAAGQKNSSRAEKQEQKQASIRAETIRGVVAGITAEGEVTFDYAHNRVVAAEGAFLTVVASPVKSEKRDTARQDKARAEAKPGEPARKRHDVYIVWLSPRTKLCECMEESGKSNATKNQGSNKTEKKECSLEKLEVGDHVEIQFQPREESSENHVAHQTERMREKHGRHRTHVGSASEVTIIVLKDDEQSHSASKEKESK
jgi:hypothetical protein